MIRHASPAVLSIWCAGALALAGGCSPARPDRADERDRVDEPAVRTEEPQACGSCHSLPPPVPHPQQADCALCHPGYSLATVNPATHGNGAVEARGLTCISCHEAGSDGAHARHLREPALSSPMMCGECHSLPSSMAHSDGTADVRWGALATAKGAVAAWDGAGCSATYCHGNFPGGNRTYVPRWQSEASSACGTCHGLPPPAPHPAQGDCAPCHPGYTIASVDRSRHVNGKVEVETAIACGTCHTLPPPPPHSRNLNCGLCHAGYTVTSVNLAVHGNGTVEVAGFTCSSCHGDPGRAATALNPQLAAAPPGGTGGETLPTQRAVGAHQLHVGPGAVADGFVCAECHQLPTSMGHADGLVALPFGALARTGGAAPTWNGATCSGTYCHGNFRGGNVGYAPDWTRPAASACGTCHGVPPPAPHPGATGSAACAACHSSSVDASGTVLTPGVGGTHLDGRLDVAANHGAEWMNPASPQFHALSANAGIAGCQTCHGQALDGAGGMTSLGCNACHQAGGAGNDFTTCTACHGGTSDATGAPPRLTWPGGTSSSLVGVGAHTSHVAATHDLSQPLGCEACHQKPASLVAPGHVDGVTQVTGYSGTNTLLLAQVGDPGWSSGAASCATSYCHGSTLDGGSFRQPSWRTVNGSQVTCAGCHGMPPRTGPEVLVGQSAHAVHVTRERLDCSNCHPGYGYSVTAGRYVVDPVTHVDGKRDAIIAGVRREGWTTCSNASCHAPFEE